MSIEELLNPRFEVIADFPNNIWKIGKIVSNHQISEMSKFPNLFDVLKWFSELEKYPHLFKKLNWWEKRTKEEMPIYIKSLTQVVKPKWELVSWDGSEYWRANTNEIMFGSHYDLKLFLPTTESEYLQFLKND